MVGAAAVGAAAWPVGLLGRRVADWVVYRGRPDATAATGRMLARLGRLTTSASAPAILLDAAVDAVHLDAGRITGTWFEPVERGTVEHGAVFPVTYRGEELAILQLSPRRGESGFTARDRRVVAALVGQAAPALHGARTLAELRESRARLVTAREEERRRLRRELHDSLGPALSGLSLSAAALARRTGLPEATELHRDIQDVVHQTREIAYELRPPVLDDHGLVAAILDGTAHGDRSPSGSPHRNRSCYRPPSTSPRSGSSARRWPTLASTPTRAVSRSTWPSSTAGLRFRCPTTAVACHQPCDPGSGCTPSPNAPPSLAAPRATTAPHLGVGSWSHCRLRRPRNLDMSRVVVVDDHPLFRKGFIALLRAEGHDVVAEASDGVEAVTVVSAELPDVVLMDLSMPLRDGFEATARITAAHPNTKVVVITLFDDEASVVQALQAGASGYVSKQADPDQIIGAVEAVVHGAMWLGAGVARPALPATTSETLPGHLTAREATIADLLSRGLTNPMIAERLSLSTKTVANYVSAVILKLGATDRDEAARIVRMARRHRSS